MVPWLLNHLGVLRYISLETIGMRLCLPSDEKLIAGITSCNTMLGNYKKYMYKGGVAMLISEFICKIFTYLTDDLLSK